MVIPHFPHPPSTHSSAVSASSAAALEPRFSGGSNALTALWCDVWVDTEKR